MKIAILSDIHGNSWALAEVLKDLEKKKPDLIVNLGDSLYGPLNPKETFKMLKSVDIISISGNQDRSIIENIGQEAGSLTLKYVIDELNDETVDWLNSLNRTHVLDYGVFLCHGTPSSDTTYLLEQVCESFININDSATIKKLLTGVTQNIILCGHSHRPGNVHTAGRIIINPGSVGLQAYDEDIPIYHKIENFSSNAQYCFAEFSENGIRTEQISIPYDFEKAVQCAIKNNRMDWAKWLKTGRA
jgi:predicted phosphodiesterase